MQSILWWLTFGTIKFFDLRTFFTFYGRFKLGITTQQATLIYNLTG